MAYLFRTRTDGLGHATLRGCQDRFEAAPPYAGDDDTPDVDGLTDEVTALLGRACRAMPRDPKACADLLRNASRMLAALADEVAQA